MKGYAKHDVALQVKDVAIYRPPQSAIELAVMSCQVVIVGACAVHGVRHAFRISLQNSRTDASCKIAALLLLTSLHASLH